jgi:hypothetical protein
LESGFGGGIRTAAAPGRTSARAMVVVGHIVGYGGDGLRRFAAGFHSNGLRQSTRMFTWRGTRAACAGENRSGCADGCRDGRTQIPL